MSYFTLESSGLTYTDQYCYPQSCLAEKVNLCFINYSIYMYLCPLRNMITPLFNSIIITVIVIFTANIVSNILNTL